jgi:hypothetical protein
MDQDRLVAYIPVIDSYSFLPSTIYDLRKMVSEYNVTHMTIARQRLGKHSPRVALSTTEGCVLLGADPQENTSLRICVYLQLPSNGCPSSSRIFVRITQPRAVNKECVSAGTCLSSRCLAVRRYVTII